MFDLPCHRVPSTLACGWLMFCAACPQIALQVHCFSNNRGTSPRSSLLVSAASGRLTEQKTSQRAEDGPWQPPGVGPISRSHPGWAKFSNQPEWPNAISWAFYRRDQKEENLDSCMRDVLMRPRLPVKIPAPNVWPFSRYELDWVDANFHQPKSWQVKMLVY
jgi:hypothetical protein